MAPRDEPTGLEAATTAASSAASASPPGLAWEDQILVAAVSGGDQLALRRLYDRHGPLLLHVAFSVLGNWESAEEVVQDVFIRCWRQASRYDASRGSPAGWLLAMTRSVSIDHLRRRNAARRSPARTVPLQDVPDGLLVFRDHAGSRIETGEVAAALRELPDEMRTAILLATHAGLTHSEVARFMEVPDGTAKSWIRRGLLRVRERLGPGGDRHD